MQPIQDIVEDAVQRNLADIAAFGVTQIGCDVQIELFFRYFYRYLAHEGHPFSPSGLALCVSHHAPCAFGCQWQANLKFCAFCKSLNEFVAKIKADPQNAGRMDAAALGDTVTKYKGYCTAGVDSEFNRLKATLIPFTDPPYYAVAIYPTSGETYGGPRINGKCQVVRHDGSVIPRLYVAGLLGGIQCVYPYPIGPMPGTVMSGRIAGENAVKETSLV